MHLATIEVCDNDVMGMHQYFMGMTQLEMLQRAPGIFKYQPHTVAAHSWKVAHLAQFLADVEDNAGNPINWQSLYEKALNHDYSERFIGDIKTPVKYATTTLRHMLANVEEKMANNFIQNEIPAPFQAAYTRRLGESKDDSLEGRILVIADKLDLLYEAFGELEKFNPDPVFREMFSDSLSVLALYQDMPCARYFATEILPEIFTADFAHRERLVRRAQELIHDFPNLD